MHLKFSDCVKSFWHYVTVPLCVHCGEVLARDADVFCADCFSRYENARLRNCSRCSEILAHCSCTNDYLDAHLVHRLIKIIRYVSSVEDLPQNRLIFSLKRENRKDVARFCGEALAEAIRFSIENYKDFVLVYVPRRSRERRKYGLDQAKVLAKTLGTILEIPVQSALHPRSKKTQKRLSAEDRKKNAAFSPRRGVDLSGKRVLLVDDIVTTGATMGSAAMQIKGLGAKEIVGVCFAIAYKDPYVPFEKPPYKK